MQSFTIYLFVIIIILNAVSLQEISDLLNSNSPQPTNRRLNFGKKNLQRFNPNGFSNDENSNQAKDLVDQSFDENSNQQQVFSNQKNKKLIIKDNKLPNDKPVLNDGNVNTNLRDKLEFSANNKEKNFDRQSTGINNNRQENSQKTNNIINNNLNIEKPFDKQAADKDSQDLTNFRKETFNKFKNNEAGFRGKNDFNNLDELRGNGGFRGKDEGRPRVEGGFRGVEGSFRGVDGGLRGVDGGFRGGESGFRGGESGFRGGESGFRGGESGFRGGEVGFRGGEGGFRRGPFTPFQPFQSFQPFHSFQPFQQPFQSLFFGLGRR